MKNKIIWLLAMVMMFTFILSSSAFAKDEYYKTDHVTFYEEFDTSKLSGAFYESEDVIAIDSKKISKLAKKDDDKTKKAKLSFDCDDGIYKLYYTPEYQILQSRIIETGDQIAYVKCKNGKIEFDVDGFSSYAIIRDNVVAYYTFDDDYTDVTGNGYDLTNVGASLTASGKVNGGVNALDGNEYLNIGAGAYDSHGNTPTLSMNTWFKTNVVSGTRYIWALDGYWYARIIDTEIEATFKWTGTEPTLTGVTDNQWHMITVTADNTTERVYIDGVSVANKTRSIFNIIGDSQGQKIGNNPAGTSQNFRGTLDEFGFWNVTLTHDEIHLLYNDGDGIGYPFTVQEPLNITWKSQTPNDLDFDNIFEGVNITYTVTGYNDSLPVYLNYTLEDENPTACEVSINDTCITYPTTVNYTSINGDDFLFQLDKFQIVPSIYNSDPEYMYNTPGQNFSLDSNNDRLKIKFNNFRNDTPLNIFEIDLQSADEQNLEIFYCNSTYVDGSITVGSQPLGCAILGQIQTTATLNHTHGLYSRSQTVDFGVDNGTVSGVVATNTSYFIIPGVSGNSMNVRYISNNTNTVELSGNGGGSYTAQLGTVDAHLHQYQASENFTYEVCAYNYTGGLECSDTEYDAYGQLPSFEELPFVRVTNPPTGSSYTIASDLIITWAGFDGDGDDLKYSLTVNDVLILDTVTNTSYDIDLSAYLGDVTINVEVCEDGSVTRCTDDEVVIDVTTVSEAVGDVSVSFNFSWDINNSAPEVFECPTNIMQFSLIILFYVIGVGLMYFGYRTKEYMGVLFYYIGCSLLFMCGLYVVGCSFIIGTTLFLIPVAFAVCGVFLIPWFTLGDKK